MGVIPKRDVTMLHIYRCGGCDKLWSSQVGDFHMSCGALPGAGSCCHFGEPEVSADGLATMKAALGTPGR